MIRQFATDPNIAITYLAIKREDLRVEWLRDCLRTEGSPGLFVDWTVGPDSQGLSGQNNYYSQATVDFTQEEIDLNA